MRINLAHLRERAASGGWVNFAVFDARSSSGSQSDNARLLSQLTARARASNLRVEQSALAKELADGIAGLKPGEVSEPLQVGNACFLLLLEEKRAAHNKALSEVREEIESNLMKEERDRLEKQWIDRLKKKTFIRYF